MPVADPTDPLQANATIPPSSFPSNIGNYAACLVEGGLPEARAQFAAYYESNVNDPVREAAEDLFVAGPLLSLNFVQPAETQLDLILATATITGTAGGTSGSDTQTPSITTSDDVAAAITASLTGPGNVSIDPQTQTTTAASGSLTTSALLTSVGMPLANSRLTAEAALRQKGINFVNGIYLLPGITDMTCVREMYRVLGGNPCETLLPYLSKPAGQFTFIITRKFTLTFDIKQNCEPVVVPNAGQCQGTPQVFTGEQVLGVDAGIDATLATYANLNLTRDDLTFYVFWQEAPQVNSQNKQQMLQYGLTLTEIGSISVVEAPSDQFTVCNINDPVNLVNLCSLYPDDVGDIIQLGPDTLTVDPDSNEVFDELDKAISNPTPPENITDYDNSPLMAIGVIDPDKSFRCPAALTGLEEGLQEAQDAVLEAYQFARNILLEIQGALRSVGNEATRLLSALEQYAADKFPGKMLSCMFAGSGFGLAFPIPRGAIDALQFLLNNVIGNLQDLLNLFDGLLTGLLGGFCLSATLIANTLGVGGNVPVGGSSAVFENAGTASFGFATDSLSCAAFEIPWPDFVIDLLQCLLKILQMLQRMIDAAARFLQDLIATIRSFALTFSFGIQAQDVCNNVALGATLTAIQQKLQL